MQRLTQIGVFSLAKIMALVGFFFGLIAGVTKDLVGKVKAGELVASIAVQVGGKGGGRPDMAQAGGSQPENLDTALEQVLPWITAKLA